MMTDWSDRLIAAVYRFRLRSQLSGKTGQNHRISNPWHAVSVVTGSLVKDDYVCNAVDALRDKRMLSSEAPQLPLVDCGSPDRCTCHYQHHADRRRDRRRARDNALPRRNFLGAERRGTAPGRRATDI